MMKRCTSVAPTYQGLDTTSCVLRLFHRGPHKTGGLFGGPFGDAEAHLGWKIATGRVVLGGER